MNTVAGGETARTLTEVSLPNGSKLQAYPGGIEDQLVRFIGSAEYKNASNDQLKDRWFNFDDLNFVFGKTELTPESKRQLDNIVAILKAFPDAKIKVGGYTDKKGDDAANLKLSDSRAKAVQAALQKAGVGAQVPEAEGYGEQFAKVDENASDEQRMVDRKTAVRLIK
jgi:outer membrane protein OmpA-like peptidoglycan-associated protein